MKYINIIVEGSSEEAFVNDILTNHFSSFNKFISVRKIRTGWDRLNNKPAKGGLLKYNRFRSDVLNWIQSDRGRQNTFYTSFLDLYAFPKDNESPYVASIQNIVDPYEKIAALEKAIGENINHEFFIPYVQLHEFEAFLLVEPDRLLTMYPDSQGAINRLKKNIGEILPEEINASPHTAPSKRIIKYLPEYEGQKAQVGPLVAEDIGLVKLRNKCPHFDEWISKLEEL
jgi:hypothetical protein